MIEVISSPLQSSSFTLLSEHQAETPSTFFASQPILHLHLPSAQLLCSPSDPLINAIARSRTAPPTLNVPNGTSGTNHTVTVSEQQEVLVEVWVTSQRLLLWNPSIERGLSLQYPDIELHALRRLDPAPDAPNSQEQRQGVYLHIANHAQGGAEAEDDEDEEGEDSKITEITIIPARIEPHEGRDSDPPVKPPAEALFQALSTCANLHPDPTSSDDDEDDEVDRYIHEGDVEGDVGGMIIPGTGDGSLPEPFPGSGGWITAENVGRYFDADGQWLGRGAESVEAPLGPGSGRVRTRDEADAGDVADAETDGYENGTDESKWQRTG